MADRYWVGGTASWDATAGTKWATTSGGAGGASVPTSADDVFFDAASGAVTVTVPSSVTCQSLNFTGFTGTFTGAGQVSLFSGNLTIVSGVTWTHTGTFVFSAASLVTTAGKTLAAVLLNNPTSSVSLQDALTCSGAITITQGTFTTNNYNVTASSLSSSNSNTRTINLGSSTVTLSSTSAIAFTTNTGLTFNAGTSTIVCTANATIQGGTTSGAGVTFYNVSFTSTTAGLCTIQAINTFNNLSVTAPSSAGVQVCRFDSRQTINGTLSTSGTAGNRRVWFYGQTYGIAQTLTINATPSLTDADFRDIYVIGTAAPISGTRIGDLRGCRGITFSTPKTVYWNLAGTNAWTANAWASTSGGTPNTDNFPLAQDIAVIDNSSAGSTIQTLASSTPMAMSTIDASLRTSAITLDTGTSTYYGDFKLGSGVTITGASISTFSGRNTQTITSAGKTFSGGITIDSYGGTVQLADALNLGSNSLTVTNGTFDTKNYNFTAGAINSSNSNVRAINFGSSTVTLSTSGVGGVINFATATNLTFSAGTSTVVLSNASTGGTSGTTPLTFYNLSLTATASLNASFTGSWTYNNFSVTPPASAGIGQVYFSANQIITGTLTCAGASPVRRIFLRSDTLGTTRTLTVNSLSADDCDFRDITIAGTAAGSSPTRAGDCGGNTGITFPAPKTVYWNLAGAQNWSATGWASSSGGTPDINNFPLAQDTAVFDNTGAGSSCGFNAAWNVGTFDASARTSAFTFNMGAASVYKDWKFGTGITAGSTGSTVTFSGRSTQTITSNGVTFSNPITIDCYTGTVQLADALTLSSTRTLTLTSGTFDAVTYNVTTGLFAQNTNTITILRMGSGTWTLSGTGSVWNYLTTAFPTVFSKGTANIVLSDTSTTARTFAGAGLSYNRLTIGGTTGTSTLTITGNNQFTELASTKTVAHTIALGSTTQTLGAWTVTGTVGNVVTVSGTATITIAGARVSGVDYLALGTTVISATSPGEFYAGANSTGGTNAILTAAPAPVTRYWRGGTGTWDASTTTNWSATSGGAGGASVPTSADAVVFDSASNATAYTVTCTATQLRCASLTMAGPASGNVTWAGTAPLAIHDNVSLAATGITRTYTGAITLSGSTTGKTFTTNGVGIVSTVGINGVGCGWSLGSAWVGNSTFTITNGAFNTANYAVTGSLVSDNANSRSISLGSSTFTSGAVAAINFGAAGSNPSALTFTAGTSSIVCTNASPAFTGNNQTFYDVAFTSTSAGTVSVSGANTFNSVSVTGITSAGLKVISLQANQTINGTLMLSAGTNAAMRTFVQSDTIGTTRTLTCAAVAAPTDVDFRDITIAGAAAPVSGTRLGDCKGNSGITFPAPKTVYWRTGTGSWGAASWTDVFSGGAVSANNIPLAQDTAVFDNQAGLSNPTVTINAAYNIGTIDMSARTSNTMTLATGTTTPAIYGNWINGTGTTLSGTGTMTFAGRGTQTITSAGRTFTQVFNINTPGGSVTLLDALNNSASSSVVQLTSGTFSDGGYNINFTSGSSAFNCTSSTATRSVNINGTLTIAGTNGWITSGITNLTVTGTGTISLTSASAKTFAGGGISYSGITLDQGGAGTLTITGNNTFKNITNSYSATGATTINIGTTTQTVTQFTATGTSGKVLTVQGTSASSPATLILTSGTVTTPDYLAITGVRAYSLSDTWYAGNNSTNNGSLGWIFSAGTVVAGYLGNFFAFF